MLASISRSLLSIFAPTLKLDISFSTMAHVGLVNFDELNGERVQLVEVVAGVGDGIGSESWAN